MTGRPWWLSRSRICHNVGNLGSIPGLGRSPGEGNGYLLQYSGLENSMDCRVHGVAKSQTQLSKFHFHMIVGLAILQFEGQTSRLEAQGRAELATWVQRQPGGRILSSRTAFFFSHGLQLIGWVPPILQRVKCFIKCSLALNANLIWKISSQGHLDCCLTKYLSTVVESFAGGSVLKNLPTNAGDTGDVGSFPGLGRSSGGGNGNPCQYSCLEDSMDRGAWRGYTPWVAKS